MAGKARVHQLAKELGVTSKQILAELRAAGEFVKSASSTIEGPVARRLREAHGGKPQQRKVPTAGNPARKAVKSMAGKKPVRPRQPPQSQIDTICERYRVAAASADPKRSVDQFYTNCEVTYALPRKAVRQIIAANARRNPHLYLPRQVQRDRSAIAQPTNSRKGNAAIEPRPIGASPHGAPAGVDRPGASKPRVRVAGLPPISATVDVDAIATAIADTPNEPTEAVRARLQEIAPGATGYGYLSWRFSASRLEAQSGSGTTTAAEDLAILASIIDVEKHLIRVPEQIHGSVLEDPDLAKRVLDNRFDHLISDEEDFSGLGGLASDQSRRVKARFDFLRRAVVLTIAGPTNDVRLWTMLADLQSRTLVGTAP